MIIGVTGNSGSGKSTFAKHFADKIGFVYVDIDHISMDSLNQPEVLQTIINKYGREILSSKGTVSSQKVGEILSISRESAKEIYEVTLEYITRSVNKIIKDNNNVILDWVLLPDTYYWDLCDYTILMKTDLEQRLQKVSSRDNLPREYCVKRDNHSPNYTGIGVYSVIYNDYSPDSLQKAMDIIAQYIKTNYSL